MNSALCLIPTQFELNQIDSDLLRILRQEFGAVELCGFGQIVASVRTASCIAARRPSQVFLLGIAGALREDVAVGGVVQFSDVVCYGIGVGMGAGFQPASEMGWQQWSDQQGDTLGDHIVLKTSAEEDHVQKPRTLLSCCAASLDDTEAAVKRSKYPSATAEDMEGFGVAVACQFAQVPPTIIRGMSNRAGDRNHQNWKTKEAMNHAVEFALKALK